MNPISVILVDDHTLVREGFRGMLRHENDIKVVGEAQDGHEAIILAERLHPDVVLMDIAMPRLDGLAATRQLLKSLPATKVLILSAYGDDAYVNNAVESGAMGFLLKQTSIEVVGKAIRTVYQGKPYFSIHLPVHRENPSSRSSSRLRVPDMKRHHITERETQILRLIAEGKANKETAVKLGIGIKTVEKHREHLMKKLGIHDTAGLTRYAISTGIIESDVRVTVI